MDQKTNTEQVLKAMSASVAIAEAIEAVGEIPSGELYAILMGKMSIETYEGLIQALVGAGLIRRERSHMLVWIGPKKKGVN